MRTADDFYHLIGWLITFLHFIGVFVLVFPLSFLYYSTKYGKKRYGIKNLKMCPSLPPPQHFPWRLFGENVQQKGGKWHFRDPNFPKFSEEVYSHTPSLTFFPVRTSSKSGWVTSRNHQAYFIIFHRRWRINGKFAHSLTHQKNAQAQNCNQPFNLMERKRANFIVGSKL